MGKKRLLFLLGSFTVGGIQSNFLRISKVLSEEYDIAFLLLTNKVDSDLFDSLKDSAKVYFATDFFKYSGKLFNKLNLSALTHSLPFLFSKNDFNIIAGDFDFIHVVDSETLYFGAFLAENYQANLTVGCYHPREFTWNVSFFTYFRDVQKQLISLMPSNNVFYFNNETANFSCESLGFDKTKAIVIPLSVTTKFKNKTLGSKFGNKIISIGRLVEFKAYIKYFLLVLDEINNQLNAEFEFHIYGEGDELYQNELKDIASSLSSTVVFHGTLPYRKIPDTIQDSFLCVGVGSSLIETSALGVPSLYGIDSLKSPVTYGFFPEVNGTNLGEYDKEINTYSFVEKIEFLSSLSDSEYASLCRQHQQKTKMFCVKDISKKWYLSLENSKKIQFEIFLKPFHMCRYFVSNLLWCLLNGFGLLNDRNKRY